MSKQLSIYSKLHHHSNKDVTISIGKDKRVNITFRNYSWRKVTDSEFVSIAVKDSELRFGDGMSCANNNRVYKLTINKKVESARYVGVTFNSFPELYKFVERRGGDDLSISFNLHPIAPVIQTPERVTPRTAETPHRVFMDGEEVELYNPPTNPLRVALNNMDKSSLVDLCLCLIKGGKDNV